MKVRTLKNYVGSTNWHEILNNELNQVGFFCRPIGQKHYAITDANEKQTGWILFGHELTADFKNINSFDGICTVVFNLEKCTFELCDSPKSLYITSELSGAYISFIEHKKV